jgi:hypothetical protein
MTGRVISKKCWPQELRDIRSGIKPFDVRLGNFECNVGDRLYLREYDPATKRYGNTGTSQVISYVMKTKNQPYWPQEEVDKYGFTIVGFGRLISERELLGVR